MKTIAEQVRELRESGRTKSGRPPSQQNVADAAGWTKNTYIHYETKFSKAYLPMEKAEIIADALAKFGVPRESVLALAARDTPVVPSASLLKSALAFLFEYERGARVPEEALRDYALALRDVIASVARGELVDADDRALRTRLRSSLDLLSQKSATAFSE
jgi:transcriptional regulator with XRE-family HTH domain